MFKRFLSRRTRLYLGGAAWLLLAYLIVSLRYVSQVGKAVQMDIQATALTEEILRPTDTPAEQARFTELGSTPRGRDTPLLFLRSCIPFGARDRTPDTTRTHQLTISHSLL